MPSLTHAEARARAELLTVRSYRVELDLTRGADRFGSTSTIRFGCTRPGTDTFAELRGTLRRATLNGRELDPTLVGNRLPLPDLAADNELVVVADGDYSHTGEGLHRFVDPADGSAYVYAMSFLDCAQNIFCCFDQPDLKAPVTLAVTVPEEWTVLANERGARIDARRWEFTETRPIATYMTTVCAGPYVSRYREHDGIRLGWHARASLAEPLAAASDELLELTARCFDAYHALFGVRYGFGDTYDQVFVPEFNAGAMENPGCVTHRDELLYRSAVTDAELETRAAIVAHEMAHMWFGDLVTMRWWDDLWLNESFATYLSYRVLPAASRYTDAWAGFAGQNKLAGYAADQSSWTHPVAPDEVADADSALVNFDQISYPKGASVLRQLAAWLGDEAFLAGLRDHFARHSYGNATLADLVDSLAAASGRDVAGWARQWLRTAGTNRLSLSTVDGQVGVRQQGVHGAPLRSHRIGIGAYRLSGGALVRDQRVEVEIDGGYTEVPGLAGDADLVLPNDGDLTFATVRLAEPAMRDLPRLLPAAADPLTRALLWTVAWDATRAADLPPGAFVDLVAAAVPGEASATLSTTMLANARNLVADRYLDPARRPAALATLAGTCRTMLADAAPGSGRQLAALRTLVSCLTEPIELAALLAGDLPAGAVLDAELRWRLVRRLVVLGAAGAAEIDAELARDNTGQGAVHATGCRAALPGAAAKQAAWRSMMHDETLTNRHLEALARGFWQPEQSALTAPYVERYFADILPATADRSGELAGRLAGWSFPGYAVSAGTVAAAEALLARDDLAAGVRRALATGRDELRIALAARSA
ncbi:aminopeptidase [Actinocatenispora thailandica]|uniref:Aminopeptidase N n=1 Tax=Actinocatenispora thailandica TaxID=227318 RepID=A0A7R7DLJ7_9ACTN|nr:aminopeptidase N [Actinocatenispora thailandica]BCJ33770.1 aminopeptidase [Actinocatenispora thailandica]